MHVKIFLKQLEHVLLLLLFYILILLYLCPNVIVTL